MKTGKKTSATTTAWFERGDNSPNQALKIGAKATMGTAFTATARGVSVWLAVLNAVTNRAAATPSNTPATRPVTTMNPVTLVAVWIAAEFSAAAPAISEGGGRTNPSGRVSHNSSSQPPNPMTAAMIGGSSSCSRLIEARPPGAFCARR